MLIARLIQVLFGLVVIFSAPELGEKAQCFTEVFQQFGSWKSLICEPYVAVKLWFIVPFELIGVVVCVLALRNSKLVTARYP